MIWICPSLYPLFYFFYNYEQIPSNFKIQSSYSYKLINKYILFLVTANILLVIYKINIYVTNYVNLLYNPEITCIAKECQRILARRKRIIRFWWNGWLIAFSLISIFFSSLFKFRILCFIFFLIQNLLYVETW